MSAGPAETRITVEIAARVLVLSSAGAERRFHVAVGRNAGQPKSVVGDEATPLGDYYVCAKNPCSQYFLSVCISYPNAVDAARGLAAGLVSAEEHTAMLAALAAGRMPPQHTRLGGEIYIHGGRSEGTRGCIAVADEDMQIIYDAVALGTPVRIVD